MGMRLPRTPSPQSVDAVAARLDLTRNALALTPAEFCRASGVRPNAYANWIARRSRPDLESAIRICRAFGCTLDWIYLGAPAGLTYELHEKVAPMLWQMTAAHQARS